MIMMWKRGLLSFAMGEKKRGKLGKREGMRNCVWDSMDTQTVKLNG